MKIEMLFQRLAVLAAALIALTAAPAHSHGGGLNAEGCHNNRKTGEYHCHRGPQAAQPQQRVQPAYGGGSRSFSNCAAARAAGAAPVRAGDPGYGKHLDRDGDGVGCE
ncbi:excalibur calcium-binding domain-containing protein [Emcibacter sp. SYSU 3D8]|uniref:excalibur calcium-binding domain-containing protein n=1 Tax=Emcibacter sp. SYSU 3D8 TaxID=3133969 RepID=UPI0031FEA1C6